VDARRGTIRVLRVWCMLAALWASARVAHAGWCGSPIPPCDPNDPGSKCYRARKTSPKCEPCGKCAKSPCYVGSGVYVTQATDLEVPAVGFPLVLARSYETTQAIDSPTGYGWTSSLSAHLYYASYLFAAPSTYQKEADVTMPDGARYRFVDNGNGTFTPPLGRHDTLVHNGDGTFDLTLQRTMSVYHFGADGALLTMADGYHNTTALTYDGNGRLQRIADAAGSGRYLDVFWGADGRISAVQDHSGRQVQYTYDNRGVMTSMTDPLGHSTYYTYVQGRFMPLLAAVTDHWNRLVTTVTYDNVDRVGSYTDQGETWSYTYNYQNNPLKTAKSDSQGNAWVYTFDQAGLVTDEVAPANGGGGTIHTDYSADGAVQMQVDEVGVKTYYTYDAQGNVLSDTEDYQGPNAVRYDYTYDPNFPGRVTAITPRNPTTGQVDPNWQAWRFDYYQAGDPAPGAPHHVYRVQKNGTTLDVVKTYAFDSHGRPTSVTDAEGNAILYSYDPQGNPVSVSGPPNNDGGIRPEAHLSYDALGRITSLTDPMGADLQLAYDALGRVLTFELPPPGSASPLSFTTTYSYDDFDSATGLVFSTVTDPNGYATRQGYDAYGRLARTVDALNAVTQHTYNRGLPGAVTNPNGYATTYSYNGLRQLTAITLPNGAQETYTYYTDGLLKNKTDRKAQTIGYAYDHFKRLATKTHPGSKSIAYTYSGQALTRVTDTTIAPTETHLYTYDSSYRLASETQGPRGTVNFAYTPADRSAGYSVAGGASAAYSYYPDGRLDTITWSEIGGVFKYSYNLRGQYEQILFPNGQHRDYSYDDQGRLLQIANLHPAAGNLATFSYGYDMDFTTGQPLMLGQRTSMTADVPAQGLAGALTKYYYDKSYRLSRTDYPNVAPFNGEVGSWTYDAVGNRLSSSANGLAQVYTYEKIGANPNGLQRLLSDGVSTYAYDLNGNLSSRSSSAAGYTLTWDTLDRLAALSGSVVATYTYDHLGRRTGQSAASGTTSTHLYSQLDVISDDGAAAASYLYGPGVDQPLAALRGGTASFYEVDGLGSVVLSTDSQGTVQTSSVFDAWGSLKSYSGNGSDPFAYTGREFGDGEMLYFRSRWLLPSIGRFISEDPPFLGSALGLYSYVDGNPTNAVDPFGLKKKPCKKDDHPRKPRTKKSPPQPKYPIPERPKAPPSPQAPPPKPLPQVQFPHPWDPPPWWNQPPPPPIWTLPDPPRPEEVPNIPEWLGGCQNCIIDRTDWLMEQFGEQPHDEEDYVPTGAPP
jgi:RHS repeat-associated protein